MRLSSLETELLRQELRPLIGLFTDKVRGIEPICLHKYGSMATPENPESIIVALTQPEQARHAVEQYHYGEEASVLSVIISRDGVVADPALVAGMQHVQGQLRLSEGCYPLDLFHMDGLGIGDRISTIRTDPALAAKFPRPWTLYAAREFVSGSHIVALYSGESFLFQPEHLSCLLTEESLRASFPEKDYHWSKEGRTAAFVPHALGKYDVIDKQTGARCEVMPWLVPGKVVRGEGDTLYHVTYGKGLLVGRTSGIPGIQVRT